MRKLEILIAVLTVLFVLALVATADNSQKEKLKTQINSNVI